MISVAAHPRPLDLLVLRSYVAVIDLGGFSLAASRLNLAQSTISTHIARLESTVGRTLLLRNHRQPLPTPAGERLLKHARRLLLQNALAWQDVHDQRLDGLVRMGIPDDYLVYLPTFLAGFESRFPDVELQISCAMSVDLAQQIQAGGLDLAVITRQPYSPGGEVLLREKTVWAGAPGFPLTAGRPIPLALSMEGKCILSERAVAALEAAGLPWRLAYQSSSLTGLFSAVSAGLAITVMTPAMLTQRMKTLGIEDGLPELPDVEIALLRGEHELNEASCQLAQELQAHAGRVAADRARPLA